MYKRISSSLRRGLSGQRYRMYPQPGRRRPHTRGPADHANGGRRTEESRGGNHRHL